MASQEERIEGTEPIKVMVRYRPPTIHEKDHPIILDSDFHDIYVLDLEQKEIKNKIRTFSFDRVFDWQATQYQVYLHAAAPYVSSVLQGYNFTLFSYGITASGKRHSVYGGNRGNDYEYQSEEKTRGLLARAIQQLFTETRMSSNGYVIKLSMFAIYNEQVNDLLLRQEKLEVREDLVNGIYIRNLSQEVICSEEEFKQCFKKGVCNALVANTRMGSTSLRKTTVVKISVECQEKGSIGQVKSGVLYMVVMMGSERQSKTGCGYQEGLMISTSLSSFGNVIASLIDERVRHIPYRDSRLTRIFQHALGGNSYTTLLVHLSPTSRHYDETLSSLRLAHRAKHVRNRPVINTNLQSTSLIQLTAEIQNYRLDLIKEGLNLKTIEIEFLYLMLKDDLKNWLLKSDYYQLSSSRFGFPRKDDSKEEVEMMICE